MCQIPFVLGVSGLKEGAVHFKFATRMSDGIDPVAINLKSVMASGGDYFLLQRKTKL